MTSNSQTLPNSTPNRFKPYIIHKVSIEESLPCPLQKRSYKYIHHLTLKPKNKSFFDKIPTPKTLHSVRVNAWRPGKNLSAVKKLVKPYKKYLRNLQGGANHPEIEKLLPFLDTLRVNLTPEALRRFALYPNVKKLRFDVLSDRYARMSAGKLLMKYKTRLSKTLAKINDLSSLSMAIMSREMVAVKFLLETIGENANLDSFKGLSLNLYAGTFPSGYQQLQEQNENISKVLAKLTHLNSESTPWYSFIISSAKLDHLSVLNLRLASLEISEGSKDIFQFHNFPKLLKFTLSFVSNSEPADLDFIENFSLPSSLEDLSLTLEGFGLADFNENNAPYARFFNRAQEAKGVKNLQLSVTENRKNAPFTAQFACLLIKCFGNLETLECKNYKESSFLFQADNAQAKSLDFQDFWAAVLPSKETLQSIYLDSNDIIFPEGGNPLETGFPKLKQLELKDRVSSAAELGGFCKRISNLNDITLKGVKLTDEEKLRIFLDSMKDIKEEDYFEFYLDVGEIKQKPLIDCLKKYIEIVKVKGRFGLHFTMVQIEDELEYGEILRLVVEKGCFEAFTMKRVTRLFSVMKTEVLEVSYNLRFEMYL